MGWWNETDLKMLPVTLVMIFLLWLNIPSKTEHLDLPMPKPPSVPTSIYMGASEIKYGPCTKPVLRIGWGYDEMGKPEIQGIQYECLDSKEKF